MTFLSGSVFGGDGVHGHAPRTYTKGSYRVGHTKCTMLVYQARPRTSRQAGSEWIIGRHVHPIPLSRMQSAMHKKEVRRTCHGRSRSRRILSSVGDLAGGGRTRARVRRTCHGRSRSRRILSSVGVLAGGGRTRDGTSETAHARRTANTGGSRGHRKARTAHTGHSTTTGGQTRTRSGRRSSCGQSQTRCGRQAGTRPERSTRQG